MQEDLVGKGVLRTGDHPGATEWQVKYNFAISTPVIRKPGFPTVQGHSSSIGTVTSIDGVQLPEGYFQLTAQGGKILRVKNNGLGQWTILAPF